MAPDQGPDLDLGRPQVARMYDCLLGGKDNYRSDEHAARDVKEVFPAAQISVRENRAFMHRAVRWLADEVGIRQFLDIGTGIPTEPNLHQIVQAVAPACRVVYADNDPIVRVHAQALLTSAPEGRTAFIEADVTEPETILGSPVLQETLDLSQPVALSLIALLHFIPDHRDAHAVVSRLFSALPSGSALAISHVTGDFAPEAMQNVMEIYRENGLEFQVRGRSEIERFFYGFELVEPGIAMSHRWHPDSAAESDGTDLAEIKDADVSTWVGVARKP